MPQLNRREIEERIWDRIRDKASSKEWFNGKHHCSSPQAYVTDLTNAIIALSKKSEKSTEES